MLSGSCFLMFLAYPLCLVRRFPQLNQHLPQIERCNVDRSRRRRVNCRNDWASYWMQVLFAWKWNRERAKAARTEFADRWNWRPEALEVLKCHCSWLRWENNGLQFQVDCSFLRSTTFLSQSLRFRRHVSSISCPALPRSPQGMNLTELSLKMEASHVQSLPAFFTNVHHGFGICLHGSPWQPKDIFFGMKQVWLWLGCSWQPVMILSKVWVELNR